MVQGLVDWEDREYEEEDHVWDVYEWDYTIEPTEAASRWAVDESDVRRLELYLDHARGYEDLVGIVRELIKLLPIRLED